ncbi:hypothetical protein TUN199_04230 [Pyrenophora tritici-repentis]|uniref:Uncharacterized protein n=2 Tax=Pyrenophora tritici-repentis TaxID=45151 RepID=A0A2W1DD85_9PLEO|nr:uncharacterized protein PTRG_03478 [Pyrenophora tritici-repentis Pt-1C-BFP]KAA8620490.1 hypothetical protein PtrV1_07584 [Pyrenophora tritici-repentis]EDU46316.1 conserved hypothetical protein [Pyrenophora tritici-repentis Pt-1C-BFP]KAF7448637.1 hypothetical protein A1F99_080010 [Pyrenophora tritici-repentis]KAF7572360.1 hypothetical protein PtrM4_098600 [Pyrenophora tritici-repentis]KAI0623748.1 hypothetical protein TUN199_04230 [Pyrenophora tritici-repentis]
MPLLSKSSYIAIESRRLRDMLEENFLWKPVAFVVKNSAQAIVSNALCKLGRPPFQPALIIFLKKTDQKDANEVRKVSSMEDPAILEFVYDLGTTLNNRRGEFNFVLTNEKLHMYVCEETVSETFITQICEACGGALFGDVQEHRAGGVFKLIDQMERIAGTKVTVTTYNEEEPQRGYGPGLISWARNTTRDLTRLFSKDADRDDVLPQHNDSETTQASASVNIELTPAQDLLLLACMQQSQGSQLFLQDSIRAIKSDRQLFYFIREQISRNRRTRWTSRVLKTVNEIQFTKLHLRLNNDIEPRLHKPCCRQDGCQCIPLNSNAEYDCIPAGPLAYGPPVLPAKMLHYFQHPELIAEEEMSVFNQLPKRNCGEIQATGQAPAEGWGLYYEENWNIGLIIVVMVAIVILASVLFGICWTLVKADIQGAWGVSSYMVTACGLVVALLSMMGRARSE